MTTPRSALSILLSVVAVTMSGAPPVARADLPPDSARYCKTVTAGPLRAAVMLERGSTRCAAGRRVVRGYLQHVTARRCRARACPLQVRGWACSAATAGAWPRLGSCARHRARIAFYDTATD